MKKTTAPLTLILISLISITCSASDLEASRKQYLRAEKAFSQGRHEVFQKEMSELESYPLYSYLQYHDMRRKLVRADSQEVNAFLNTHPNTWFGQDIRLEWLRLLGKREKWDEFLTWYAPTNNLELSCYALTARQQKQDTITPAEIESIWYQTKSLPKACNTVVELGFQNGTLNHDAIVKRIELAIKANNPPLVKELAPSLTKAETKIIDQWLMQHDNRFITQVHDMDAPFTDKIIFNNLHHMTEANVDDGIKALDTLNQCYVLNDSDEGELLSSIALKLAARNDPRAREWLDKIPDEYTTKMAREWRVREAIRRQDWNDVLKWTALLPADESNQDIWLYWRGRAWEKLEAPHKARRLYNQAAQTRSYYGFLAAQRLNRKLPLNHRTIPISPEMIQEVETVPGIQRAKELYLLGQFSNARREWEFTVARLPGPQQMAAAKLAHSWAWHDSALMTANKTDLIDDLEIRFPIAHLETVMIESQKRSLDPAIVLGIIRQESAFMPDARSYTGALGLMQVQPESAKDFALRVWKEPPPSTAQLFTPEYNIRVGSAFFNSLMREFEGQLPPAIAAYNAGPGRVKKWMPLEDEVPVDEWIETVPYYETREYLQHVLAYLVIYSHHLQDKDKNSKGREIASLMVMPLRTNKIARSDPRT